jgi:small subunit ribosomal protein S19
LLNVDPELEKKCEEANRDGKVVILETRKRGSVISDKMVGHKFRIHNGKTFFTLEVTNEHIGFHFGEFAPTRKVGKHGKAGTH